MLNSQEIRSKSQKEMLLITVSIETKIIYVFIECLAHHSNNNPKPALMCVSIGLLSLLKGKNQKCLIDRIREYCSPVIFGLSVFRITTHNTLPSSLSPIVEHYSTAYSITISKTTNFIYEN